MKLYSWNMLFRNREQDRAFSFIQDLDFDILCLQEVPERFLEKLKTLPHHLASGIDARIAVRTGVMTTYCVIISKHPILSIKDIMFSDPVQPRLLGTWLQRTRWSEFRALTSSGSISAEVELPNIGRVQIFDLHLTLTHPSARAHEFEMAMRMRDDALPLIVCGDLNILSSPHITVLNWLLGGPFKDTFAWRSERRTIEKKFAELNLRNPLRGKPTQTISHSQLDHILVPQTMRIVHAEVVRDRYGSDHHPVFVECN